MRFNIYVWLMAAVAVVAPALLAPLLAQQQTAIANGNLYCSDGVTPIGGNWKLTAQDDNGGMSAFKITYVGSAYSVSVDTAKLPVNKAFSIYAWYDGVVDRVIEGLPTTGRVQVIDIAFSVKAAK